MRTRLLIFLATASSLIVTAPCSSQVQQVRSLSIPSPARDVVAGDFDNSGTTGFLTVHYEEDVIRYIPYDDVARTYGTPITIGLTPSDQGPMRAIVGDFGTDGVPDDAVVVCCDSSTIVVVRDFTSTPVATSTPTTAPLPICVNFGTQPGEILVGTQGDFFISPVLDWGNVQPDGTVLFDKSFSVGTGSGDQIGEVEVADLDGDGDTDAVVGTRSSNGLGGRLEFYENSGGTLVPAGSRSMSSFFGGGFSPYYATSIRLMDLDGDSDIDILTSQFSLTQTSSNPQRSLLWALRNTNSGTPIQSSDFSTYSIPWANLTAEYVQEVDAIPDGTGMVRVLYTDTQLREKRSVNLVTGSFSSSTITIGSGTRFDRSDVTLDRPPRSRSSQRAPTTAAH